MNRRTLLIRGAAFAAVNAAMLTACGSQAPSASPTPAATTAPTAGAGATPAGAGNPVGGSSATARIAYQRTGLPLIGKNRGTIEANAAKAGVTVQWVGPFADAPTGYEAVRAGSADFFSSSTAPAVSALAGDSSIKIVAASPSAPEGRAFLVPIDSAVQGIKDLVGKKVAVQRGNVAEYTLLKTLEKVGIAKDQVQEVYIAVPDAAAALAQKKIDAWVTWDPYISITEIDKTARTIFDGRDAPDFGVWIVRNDFLQAHPDAVNSVLAALKQEGDWSNANVLQALQIEGAEAKLPDTVIERMATRPQNFAIVSIDDTIEPQMQAIATWMSDGKVIPKTVDLSAYVVKNLVKG